MADMTQKEKHLDGLKALFVRSMCKSHKEVGGLGLMRIPVL